MVPTQEQCCLPDGWAHKNKAEASGKPLGFCLVPHPDMRSLGQRGRTGGTLPWRVSAGALHGRGSGQAVLKAPQSSDPKSVLHVSLGGSGCHGQCDLGGDLPF